MLAQGLAKAATLLAGQLSLGHYQRALSCERQAKRAVKRILWKASILPQKMIWRPYFSTAAWNSACRWRRTSSIVLPQNWLFLTSYKKFREKLLKNDTWHLIARLGARWL